MITLALLRQMRDDKVAGLNGTESDPKRNFYWEEMPLPASGKFPEGVWLVTRGGSAESSPKGLNLRTTVDFYVTFEDKTKTEWVQSEILSYILKNRYFCLLEGDSGGIDYKFTNVRIRPTQTPQNAGVTTNGLIVKVASAELVYDKEIN